MREGKLGRIIPDAFQFAILCFLGKALAPTDAGAVETAPTYP